jgi:multiple sugar transport system permease protein
MAFDFNDFGAASAMSWLLFFVVALLTWLTNKAFAPRRAAVLKGGR